MQTRSSPSLPALHSLAREAGLSGFRTLPKPVLYRKLKDQFNIERLERVHKRGLKRSIDGDLISSDKSDASASETLSTRPSGDRRSKRLARGDRRSSKKPKGKQNSEPLMDPIMLTEIPPGTVTFDFHRPNGTKVVYNLTSLIDYFNTTGDFSEPETRIEFSESDLKKMDQMAEKAKLNKSSVLAAKRDPARFDEANFKRDAMNGLERCAGELVADMLNVIESNDPEEGQMRLVMYLFPLFSDLHRQLLSADTEFAAMCMQHFVSYLSGPPNRPTHDRFGFLPIVLHFLKQVQEGAPGDYGF
uniref:Uncharacterized protein n=1 Tax=Octactis speculum TaxID=3111310 RepID=A0A7S2GAV9_9STRA|mmetsp:Transcript_41030/g.55917  ORF Transcript_41030/g.55917 Transcript_41030/m.55917 type:complete len:302 (+) Transcript_41030:150-1055(+)|eukprot:CAMPEP_0185768156 /NCGR_PEP_ID=MMETSP1174-20130828/47882_1 /TAXON_ID=35687 /ORGANISM="Dictyocha speculum, Strain CCMP1381" /LENGTH=301 /DNA_ID=CAMNT_0028452723 /DNA_START=139 /DNA_END=1044 /DNA_ORIENTATION=+